MNSTTLTEQLNDHLQLLLDQLQQGDTTLLTRLLSSVGNLRRYSLNNQLLILMQRPDATRVEGYREWQALGRQVRSGEKGIQILAPLVRKDRQSLTGSDQKTSVVYGFRTAYVFDILQTDGPALPSPVPLPEGDVGGEQYCDWVNRCPYPVRYAESIPGFGFWDGKEIQLHTGKNRNRAEMLTTLFHEWAHADLHSGSDLPVRLQELEAEAVAFAVGQHLGINSLQASTLYLQVHQVTPEELQQVLRRISGCAGRILDRLLAVKPDQGLPAA